MIVGGVLVWVVVSSAKQALAEPFLSSSQTERWDAGLGGGSPNDLAAGFEALSGKGDATLSLGQHFVPRNTARSVPFDSASGVPGLRLPIPAARPEPRGRHVTIEGLPAPGMAVGGDILPAPSLGGSMVVGRKASGLTADAFRWRRARTGTPSYLAPAGRFGRPLVERSIPWSGLIAPNPWKVGKPGADPKSWDIWGLIEE